MNFHDLHKAVQEGLNKKLKFEPNELLTNDDIGILINAFFYLGMQPSFAHYANFARAIEAKLQQVLLEKTTPKTDEFTLRGILASELKCWHRLSSDEAKNLLDFMQNMSIKLAQRTWVGLTYKEKQEFRYSRMTTADFIEEIEAKLKEKNT